MKRLVGARPSEIGVIKILERIAVLEARVMELEFDIGRLVEAAKKEKGK